MKYIGLLIASLLILISPLNLAHGESSSFEKKEKIIGTVIAQYSFQPCMYHPCALWLIVRVQDNKTQQPRYAQITVEYFPDNFPSELVENAKRWQFEAVRDVNSDAPIEKYLRAVDSETGNGISEKWAVPAWKLLSGAENETLPVGEVLPSYFVKTGKYKAYRK
jgi:hypothetical protein